MVSKYKSRAAGVRGLVSRDDYDNAFFLCFGRYSVEVLCLPYCNYWKVLYLYGLRKVCGYGYTKMQLLCGDSCGYNVTYQIALACRFLCIYDAKYNADFVADYKRLKAVCKPFKKVLSSTERGRIYRAKRANDKKRVAKIQATKLRNKQKREQSQ